jgi:hypothetical protein
MSLPSDVGAVITSRDPALAFLIKFDFVSITKRVWTGFGKLKTLDGNLWDGLGEVISIDGLSQLSSTAATAGRLSVSGVSPTLLPTAIGEAPEYLERPVSFFLQGFKDRRFVSNPCALALRIITGMEISRDGATRTIAITHESPYIGRNNGANGYYTDQDQQRRFPGDRACERTPYLAFKRDAWPDY